jgi:hypothetical protein
MTNMSFLDYRQITDMSEDGYIYDNQFIVAKEIMNKFYDNEVKWIILQAQTQCGKTGVVRQLADYINNDDIIHQMNIIDKNNFFCIMGMNDNELKQQTIDRMPEGTVVLHNSDIRCLLKKYSHDDKHAIQLIYRMKNRSLITIDESHYAQNKNSIIHKLFQLLDVSPDGDLTDNNNIHIVSISATSMSESANNSKFKQSVLLHPGIGYYGINDIFQNNKIHQSNDLNMPDILSGLIDLIIQKCEIDNYYFIIRLTGMRVKQHKVRTSIQRECVIKHIDINIIDYSMITSDTIMSINDIIGIIPNKPTIIYIKNRLRAGVSLITDHIAIMYDSHASNCDVVGQSLLGRICGYNRNGLCEIYCNKSNAEKYLLWIQNDFSVDYIPTNSKNIKNSTIKNIPIHMTPCEYILNNNNPMSIFNHLKECNICKESRSRDFDEIFNYQLIIKHFIYLNRINSCKIYDQTYAKYIKNKESNIFKTNNKNPINLPHIKESLEICLMIDIRNTTPNGNLLIIHETIPKIAPIETTLNEMFNINSSSE